MIICPKCNAEIENDSFYCDQCGQPIYYCTLCGRPGKGQRCTHCGGVMISGQEKMEQSIDSTAKRKDAPVTITGQSDYQHIPEISFMNENLHIHFIGTDGAIIGRRHGIYQKYFGSSQFVSGTHAQLNYRAGHGWYITDLGSKNGTSVDGIWLNHNQPCELLNGSKVMIANIEFNVTIK